MQVASVVYKSNLKGESTRTIMQLQMVFLQNAILIKADIWIELCALRIMQQRLYEEDAPPLNTHSAPPQQ
jgi:hypothetical protein